MKSIEINKVIIFLYKFLTLSGEYEPIELDRSQMTQMSLNGSLRKSLSNASAYYQDIVNNNYVNQFNSLGINNNNNSLNNNHHSSNSLRGRYSSFNELINVKSTITSNADPPSSQKDLRAKDKSEELYEIKENSLEITDLASSRMDTNNLSLMNNINNSLDATNSINNNNNNIQSSNILNVVNEIKNNENNINYIQHHYASESNHLNANIISHPKNNVNNNIDDISLHISNTEVKEKKYENYDNLLNSTPNSDSFNYNFEDFSENNNSNFDVKSLNFNDMIDLIDNNKKLKTVDVLTKEFMMRKMKPNLNGSNKKDNKDSKIFNLKKAMQTQQKNNY